MSIFHFSQVFVNFAKEQGDDDRLTAVLVKAAPAPPTTRPRDPPIKPPQPGKVLPRDTPPPDSQSQWGKSETAPDEKPSGSHLRKNQSNGGGGGGAAEGSGMEMTTRLPVEETSPPPVQESCCRPPTQELSRPPVEDKAPENPPLVRGSIDGSSSSSSSNVEVQENFDTAVRSPGKHSRKDPASLFIVGSTTQDSKV